MYLEGHGDLVSRLIMGIFLVITWLIGLLTYLVSPHYPATAWAPMFDFVRVLGHDLTCFFCLFCRDRGIATYSVTWP